MWENILMDDHDLKNITKLKNKTFALSWCNFGKNNSLEQMGLLLPIF
jgi:hypothetical protein